MSDDKEHEDQLSPWDRGLVGEQVAAKHLETGGMQIIRRRWRSQFGEIDLIGLDGLGEQLVSLVFVEVKTRKSKVRPSGRRREVYRPAHAVGKVKQQRLRGLADAFVRQEFEQVVSEWGLQEWVYRFDIVEVFEYDEMFSCRHLKNAF